LPFKLIAITETWLTDLIIDKEIFPAAVATTTIVGQKEADSASHSSSLCPTAKASGPNSLTEPDSSPGKYQTSSMGSTTYSPGPSSVFNSPNHAPAEQHSTN